MFQQALSIASWEYFFLLLEHRGTTALQVSNVMRNVFGIFGFMAWSFAGATNSLVSNIIGQGKLDWFWPLIKRLVALSFGITFSLLAILNLFPILFLSIFGQDSNFYDMALPTLRVVSVALVLMSVSTILMNAVVATGHSKFSFICEVGSLFVYLGFVYWALESFKGSVAFSWVSEWLYWLCLGFPSLVFLILWQRKREKNLVKR
jgi:Na+-driven multidrug efflux pump